MKSKLISIIGPPGSGKTTLAEFLSAELPARIIYEDYKGNPFLADSYEGDQRTCLSAQLYYLFSRVKQLDVNEFADGGFVVSDYGFCQDRIYAEQKLSDRDMEIYEKVSGDIGWMVKPPELIIHLDASLDELKCRISARGRDFEKTFTDDFLKSISSAYTDIESEVACPVIIIDTDSIDIRQETQRKELIAQIIEKC